MTEDVTPEKIALQDWHPYYSPAVLTMLSQVISGVAAVAMMIGGAVPYIPQYRTVKQTQNAEGFSTYVCLSLLVANILRILFWFGRPFELPLLIQSIIMIGAMLVMLQLVVQVRKRTALQGSSRKHFRDFRLKHFWQWTDFQSYIEFLSCFTMSCVTIFVLFSNNSTFIETVGFMAVFTEAMLGLPQFYRNYRNRSTAGMSVAMVAMWTSGDLFKTVYFVIRDAPLQFAICGCLQVMVDIAILLQVVLYGSNKNDRSFMEIPRE